ncbi:hypothetical protein RZS08_60005, partial [Arthrospira platensis SPKY1]|nr:hypothetical protein [Arthrospira platensis SPKY1]
SQFSEDALRGGREIYKTGLIDALELNPEDAVIHCKFDRKNTAYAIVQAGSNGHLEVRGSSDDRALSNEIAVAGLYEIEELLMETVSPVAAEAPAVKALSNATSAEATPTTPEEPPPPP